MITESSSATDTFDLDSSVDINLMYINQPVMFVPTYYSTTVTRSSETNQVVTNTVGGIINTLTVEDTSLLYQWMPVNFSGTVFGGVITDFTYYISSIIDGTTIQLSSTLFGTTLLLNTASGSMNINYPSNTDYLLATSTSEMDVFMPIQFTGRSFGGIVVSDIYYINDIINATHFTIADSLLTVTATDTTASTNLVTLDSSVGLKPLIPIKFSGTGFGNIVTNTKYYISNIPNSTQITIASSLIEVNCTATAATSNLITVTSTAGFVVNNPIIFVGNTFGNIVAGQVYYISVINNSTTFTISNTIGGFSVTLTSAVGEVTAKTTPASVTLTTSSGVLTGTTTTGVRNLSSSRGSMIATFSTSLFGGITEGTVYYIHTITPGTPNKIKVTATSNGISPVTLTTFTGSMMLGEVGWDHINVGTQIEPILDSTSLYFIESRAEFSSPTFGQSSQTLPVLGPGISWISAAYGNQHWIAIADGNFTAASSNDGIIWTSLTLPLTDLVASYKSIAYGNNHWVMISNSNVLAESGSRVLYSNSDGASWKLSYLPSKTSWNHVEYGNGTFVAISATSAVAYSNDHGKTWSSGTGMPNTTWSGIAYGAGIFVAVASGGTIAAYSTNNGQTWTASTLPLSTTWSGIVFGAGIFVAISSTNSKTAYSFNGVTWYTSNIAIQADKIEYGQGVFLALYSASGTIGYTSEDGLSWKQRNVTNDSYADIAFGFDNLGNGKFVTVGTSVASTIFAGCKTKGRVQTVSSQIVGINLWETGSNYTTNPAITITDPNFTIPVTTLTRIGNGVLSEPTFINRGTGYNTNTAILLINGSGYADEYQTGLEIICDNVSSLPGPGDNLVITGNNNIYKVTSTNILNGTVAPLLRLAIQISPELTSALSPEHGESITIRQKYSQARLTNHDFLNIGYGNFIQSNYPGLPTETELSPQNQTIENNYGRVFYSSSDQDGNFKVGNLFGVEQATGIVTLSATQFGLEGLNELRLGGIAVGGSSVIIRQFSTDPTFIANSNNIIPTQRAIKAYITSRLTQGGSNTFTGQCTAGTVIIGGPNRIDNTVPQGTEGSTVIMNNKVKVFGNNGAWAGDGLANVMFTNSFRRGNS